MNSIPLTFDEHQIKRTVIGGSVNTAADCLNISVILLNTSGSHLKTHVFENLLECKFQSIVSVEHEAGNFSLDDMSKKFPSIKFIIPLEKTSDGELINIAMSEINSDYVLVLRDSLNIPVSTILPHLAENLTENGNYCIVPRLFDSAKNELPCSFVPAYSKGHFSIESSTAISDGAKTLYPFDYIGLYNRAKFIQMGGFDWTITAPYWQILDLSMRSWLFGEKTLLTSKLQFNYIEEPPVEDRTSTLSYLRYYLKNELPRIRFGQGIIKKRSFFTFFMRSSCGILEAQRQFMAARYWVAKNKYKFNMDLQKLIETWNE
ncbi:MAG: hypothetical protein K5681_06295 [Treponema sp.]|nr:hypothetical protein [Treponema sp.]